MGWFLIFWVVQTVLIVWYISDLHGRLDCHRQILDSIMAYLQVKDREFLDTLDGMLKNPQLYHEQSDQR
jgi:hypothetical protein